ncbi:MAG: histidine phosphatase family protein [Cyanobacteria bacterium P01_E01_bin.34]
MQSVKLNNHSQPHHDQSHLSQSQGWADSDSPTAKRRLVDYRWLVRRPANTTRVVFVRHGRSTYNDQQRFQGCSDRSVLTQQGRETASMTGRALRGIPFENGYTSPLQRSKQTALAIQMELEPGLKFADCSQLLEVNLPTWEGKTYTSVKTELAGLYQHWMTSPQDFSLSLNGGSELQSKRSKLRRRSFPLQDLYGQASDFWNHIRSHHSGELLLAVAHAGSIRAAISTAIGLSPQYYHQLQQSNCGISVVDVTWENTILRGWSHGINQTGHLAETLPKLKHGKTGLRVIAIPSHSDRVEKLCLWLAKVPIQHCWADETPSSRSLAKRLCPNMSPTTCSSLGNWSTILHHALSMQKVGIATAVLITNPNTLTTLIRAGLNTTDWPSLGTASFAANTATVLHFANRDRPPVLQSLNFIPR